MVKKKHTDRIRLFVRPEDMSFNEHEGGLSAEFDRDLLQRHLPLTSGVLASDHNLANTLSTVIPEKTREALRESEFVGVYGRVVKRKESKSQICLQYFYVWDYQAVPAHEGDYEPIFVYLDGSRRYAIYDLVHYCSRRVDLKKPGKGTLGFRMIPGWHSFLPAELSKSEIDKGIEVRPLSDQHLQSWWSIPNEEARLKVEGFIRDPFLMEAPGHFMDQPDENSQTMCCSFLQIETALSEFDDPKIGLIEGIKRAFSNCVGILALYRLGAFVQLLGEMNDIGIVNITTPLSSVGMNLATIGAMLRDGFVSLTKAGSTLLNGFYSDDED
ncbi:MAG: hypothetical protein ACFFEE_06390 [Candidatus Thorarchaeota archaeon]